MKTALIVYTIFLSCFFVYPQNKISLNSGYGYYLSNSENSLKIMGEKRYKSYFLFGFNYQTDIFGIDLMVDYSYHQIQKDDVIQFVRTASELDENGNVVVLGTIGTDASITSDNFDLNYVGMIDNNFSYGIGPSFVINNRIIKVDGFTNEGETTSRSLYDKLASGGLGANAFISYSIPFSSEPGLFASSTLKLRYTHSIWFDKGLRNLDNYRQEFFIFNLLVGIGYSF